MRKNMHKSEASGGLRFLYHTVMGRVLLKVLASRRVSGICGHLLDAPVSKCLIRPFIKGNHICLSDYVEENYACFNDCFTRRIKPELRPIDMAQEHLAAPCDGLLSVYPIEDGLVIPVKQSTYSIGRLLRDQKLAKRYEHGVCLVFRLCVDHYHRYSYPDNCHKTGNRFIPGLLHTVRPIALEASPVFTENCREYTLLHTENFGDIIQMEVGAMLVGKIENYHERGWYRRGEEKGRFLYGGSTVILLLEKDRVRIPEAWYAATGLQQEIAVQMGQCIGEKIR